MEKNWLVIIPVIIAIIALIVFLIYRNQKDKKVLMKSMIEKEQVKLPKEADTEIDHLA